MPVQDLGTGQPFGRLIERLTHTDYAVAAIDAPFSLPAAHLPPSGRVELLRQVAALQNGPDRPFPTGPSLIALAESVSPKASAKPLRACEAAWAAKGVNTRSTLWWTPRGGAPFAAACMALIVRSERPCWPWVENGPGLLAEAFPAAQLCHWHLPFERYAAAGASEVRERILAGLDRHVSIPGRFRNEAVRRADALDAILCGLAAYAVATDRVMLPPGTSDEGWIAVMA